MQLTDLARRHGLDLQLAGRARGVPLASMSDPDEVRRAVDVYAEHQRDMFGDGVRRDISALWLLQDIAWAHALLSVGLVRASGSAAYVEGGLAMHFPRDMVFAVEATPAQLRIEPVADLGAAYRAGRAYLSELLAPVVTAMLAELKTGPRAAWACVTDAASSVVSGEYDAASLASGLALFTDHRAGEEDRLLTGLTIVGSPTGPIRRRHGCCLLYAIDGMDVCFSCPRLPA
ncbi:hypothetical protein EK0264_16320 [Epidermidibacterium keratini]|uniref:Ferric siderophore reductase C-terminal domain-containing protein n=1 Tax=Epidermidibacterium keratini TaxID=1891644 RepID=A0A7L4YR21_9ACTN|nr:(2Fe-2S)-binding protein [Epidermidibacterium keratini]QHC01695.1 hypothetical protein EK0264_16320 [Epidermidibacterium keratini]